MSDKQKIMKIWRNLIEQCAHSKNWDNLLQTHQQIASSGQKELEDALAKHVAEQTYYLEYSDGIESYFKFLIPATRNNTMLARAVSTGMVKGFQTYFFDADSTDDPRGAAQVEILKDEPQLRWAAKRGVAAYADFLYQAWNGKNISYLGSTIITLKGHEDLLEQFDIAHIDAYLRSRREEIIMYTYDLAIELTEFENVARSSPFLSDVLSRINYPWILQAESHDGENMQALVSPAWTPSNFAYALEREEEHPIKPHIQNSIKALQGESILYFEYSKNIRSWNWRKQFETPQNAFTRLLENPTPGNERNISNLFSLAQQAVTVNAKHPDLFSGASELMHELATEASLKSPSPKNKIIQIMLQKSSPN